MLSEYEKNVFEKVLELLYFHIERKYQRHLFLRKLIVMQMTLFRLFVKNLVWEMRYCQKITYGADDPEAALSSFRNDYNPRIAVTVDMIATGTDVKPIWQN